MEVTFDESLALVLRPTLTKENDSNSDSENNEKSERLGFKVENLKLEGRNKSRGVGRRNNRTSDVKSWKKKFGFEATAIQSAVDMTISRSCHYRLSVPVMFWTTVFLILLARGVSSAGEGQARFSRSPKYEQDADSQPGLSTFSMQETYNVMQFLRELIQRQQNRANQQSQVYSNGEDLSDNQIDWRKVPLPLLYQIRSIINDGSKEEDKRGSYMSLCHFKICNLG